MTCSTCSNPAKWKLDNTYYCYPHAYTKDISRRRLGIGYNKYTQKRTGDDSRYADLVHFQFSRTTRRPGKRGYSYMQEFFDKDISLAYESLTREQLQVLLSTIILGDGVNKTPRSYKVSTHVFTCGANKTYAERLQSLFVRRGFKANMTVWESSTRNKQKSNQYFLRITDKDYSTIAGNNIKDGSISGKKAYKRTRFLEDKSYQDKLWCITNELGTVVVRRNGKVMIAGNCGRGVRLDPSRPEKVLRVYDFCGVVERMGRVETIRLGVEPENGWKSTVVSEVGRLDNTPLFTFKVTKEEKKARFK